MFSLSLSNSLRLCLLILTLCSLTFSAPTHHLSIGVQGNTPTLIVTSSEIGITPQTMGESKKALKPGKVIKSSEKHKTLKSKINKSHAFYDKKEKLQLMAEKSQENLELLSKTTAVGEKNKEFQKPLMNTKKTLEVMDHTTDLPTKFENLPSDTIFTTSSAEIEQNTESFMENLALSSKTTAGGIENNEFKNSLMTAKKTSDVMDHRTPLPSKNLPSNTIYSTSTADIEQNTEPFVDLKAEKSQENLELLSKTTAYGIENKEFKKTSDVMDHRTPLPSKNLPSDTIYSTSTANIEQNTEPFVDLKAEKSQENIELLSKTTAHGIAKKKFKKPLMTTKKPLDVIDHITPLPTKTEILPSDTIFSTSADEMEQNSESFEELKADKSQEHLDLLSKTDAGGIENKEFTKTSVTTKKPSDVMDHITALPTKTETLPSVRFFSTSSADIEQSTEPFVELPQQHLKKLKNISILSTTSSSPLESITSAKTILDKTSQDQKKNEMYTNSHSLKEVRDMKTILELTSSSPPLENQYLTTIASTFAAKKTIEFQQPKANQDISIVTTTPTSTPPTKNHPKKIKEKGEDFITTLELSTASGLKEITDIFTATTIKYVNNDDTFNTNPTSITPSKPLKESSTALTTNDIESATETTTATAAKQIIATTSNIKTENENDNDRNIENSTTLRNENLLLTTTEATQTPVVVSSATNNAKVEAATTKSTTIANDDDDDHNEDGKQQATTATSTAAATHKNPVETETGDAPRTRNHSENDNKNSVKLKSREEFKVTTSPAATSSQTPTDDEDDNAETMAKENPVKIQAMAKEQSIIEKETEIETTITTISTLLTENNKPAQEEQQQEHQKTTKKAKKSLEMTPKYSDYDETTTATEEIIKLIDLEKQNVNSYDATKQSSSSLISQLEHHDNGHDGLKTIKKKQLIDKHYVEALLLHNKQKEPTDKEGNNPQQQEDSNGNNTPSTTSSTSATTLNTLTSSTTAKPLLMPIKHGFLGPILMEEKTFHVIHHPQQLHHDDDVGDDDAHNNNNARKIPHLSSLETQLRNGHFVELKAKAEIVPTTKTSKATNGFNSMKATQETTTVASKIEFPESKIDDENKFLTSNTKSSNINSKVNSPIPSSEIGSENKFQNSLKVLADVKSYTTHEDVFSKDSIKLAKSAEVLGTTIKTLNADKKVFVKNVNLKTSADSSEMEADEVLSIVKSLKTTEDHASKDSLKLAKSAAIFGTSTKTYKPGKEELSRKFELKSPADSSETSETKSKTKNKDDSSTESLKFTKPALDLDNSDKTLNADKDYTSRNLHSQTSTNASEVKDQKDFQKSENNKDAFTEGSRALKDPLVMNNEEDFRKSENNKDDLNETSNFKALTDSLQSEAHKALTDYTQKEAQTVSQKYKANKDELFRRPNFKTSTDSLQHKAQKDLNNSETNKDDLYGTSDDKASKDNLQYEAQNNFAKAESKNDDFSERPNYKSLTDSSVFEAQKDFPKAETKKDDSFAQPNYKTLTAPLEFKAQNGYLKAETKQENLTGNSNYKGLKDSERLETQKQLKKDYLLRISDDITIKDSLEFEAQNDSPKVEVKQDELSEKALADSLKLKAQQNAFENANYKTSKDSLEFGTHNILLNSADFKDTKFKLRPDSSRNYREFKQKTNSPSSTQILANNLQEFEKFLPDTIKSANTFHIGNLTKLKKAAKMLATTAETLKALSNHEENDKRISFAQSLESQAIEDQEKFPIKNMEDSLDSSIKLIPTEKLSSEPKNNFRNFDKVFLDTINEKREELTAKQSDFEKVDEALTKEDKKALNAKALFIFGENKNENSMKQSLDSQEEQDKTSSVLSTTVFQIVDSLATKMPIVQANTMFTTPEREKPTQNFAPKEDKKTESKISDIQIEVYDSTIDSIVASTNFKDNNNNPIYFDSTNEEALQGKTTKPPIGAVQQERFTQYVIDRTETSTQEPINYSTIQVASGKPEPAAIEIHINVSESFGNESEDLEFSYPQGEYNGNNNNNNERTADESYDDSKVSDNIKLKVPSNSGANSPNKDSRSDEILVVEIMDAENNTDQQKAGKSKTSDDLFVSENTPPPPPPPPPYQPNFDRDSDTIFYISNTEVKVGESIPTAKNSYEERKMKLESQFFPANYMASTHPNVNTAEESNSPHHLYEEDIILSSNRNQADSLKIYRNRNEPSPPLDVTYVGESIIEVEQSPDSGFITTTYAPDQQQPHVATQQADVIIQPALLPEISIGVPVIGELPPQIELKEIDFMPNEAQLHRSGMYEENDNGNDGNGNNIFNNDIDDNTMNAGGGSSNGNGYNSHDVDNINSNSNNQRLDESSIQYGGDLIDESADGGFDGVEGSYPFGNPNSAAAAAAAASMTKTRKQQQKHKNHVADYAHLYVNYGVNNMRKDELSADVKDSGELIAVGGSGGDGGGNTGSFSANSNEQNITSFKEFLNKVSMNNSSSAYINGNLTQYERMSNATPFSVLDNVVDIEDKNTEDIVNLISLAIGLFIVILPVVVTCSMFWALRYLYKKYHSNVTDSSGYSDQTDTKGQMNEDGAEKGEFIHEPPTSSSPTNSDKDVIQKLTDTSNKPSTTDSSVKFSTEKSSQLDQATTARQCSSVSKTKDSLQLSLAFPTTPLATNIKTVHDDVVTPGPNGSITKMTLENNLLIVETEERNDISRVARETKMDYNKDGVFVVEVARGIDSKTIPESPVTEGSEKMLSMFDTKHDNGVLGYKVTNEKNCLSNEKVQIHSPPPENSIEEGPRSLHQIEEVEEPINSPHLHDEGHEDDAGLAYKSNTGLSQSDLSTTSSNDSNKGYCYGNQALYVVDQTGYSTTSPTSNVVLKCDSKDIKDEDHNPENDHYLEHSPDRKEDKKDKEDVVESIKKPEDTGNKGGEEKSPRQRAHNDREKLQEEISRDKRDDQDMKKVNEIENSITQIIEAEALKEISSKIEAESVITDELNSILKEKDKSANIDEPISILTEASVVVSPPQAETMVLEDLCAENELSEIPVAEESLLPEHSLEVFRSLTPLKHLAESPLPSEISITVEPPLSDESSSSLDYPLPVEPIVCIDEETIFAAPDKFSDHDVLENGADFEPVQSPTDHIAIEEISDISKSENVLKTDNLNENDHSVNENGLKGDEKIDLQLQEMSQDETAVNNDKNPEIVKDVKELNGSAETAQIDIPTLTNGVNSPCDLVTELTSSPLQNGHTDSETPINTSNEMENGYDSIMSLPEPPPTTTEEQLNNDLSDQQLDSLPPPPPPEIFNLKDLPPPLTNGTDTDSLPSKESNNFYNTLPPPPPTTLEVSATNGKMHASPLTPPASPPAHYTNNLHAGLCAQPIAVDVNGS